MDEAKPCPVRVFRRTAVRVYQNNIIIPLSRDVNITRRTRTVTEYDDDDDDDQRERTTRRRRSTRYCGRACAPAAATATRECGCVTPPRRRWRPPVGVPRRWWLIKVYYVRYGRARTSSRAYISYPRFPTPSYHPSRDQAYRAR